MSLRAVDIEHMLIEPVQFSHYRLIESDHHKMCNFVFLNVHLNFTASKICNVVGLPLMLVGLGYC